MILPFYVGLLLAVQVVLATLKATLVSAFTFNGCGFVVWAPSYILFLRLFAFLMLSEVRAAHEVKNIHRGKSDRNQLQLTKALVDEEAAQNRIFALKMSMPFVVVVIESIRESLPKEHLSIWITIGPLLGIILIFAGEGLHKNAWWWSDARQRTLDALTEQEEDDDDG
jgi:hypothetical protein